jgi:alkylation response protein AidB-like acyl-CoA dehydrogenase
MDFSFDDGQELFKRSARKFFETYGDKSVVKELEASESGFSAALWKGMADLGWMGVLIPPEYDGLGSSLLELAVLVEEMGRAAMPSPFLCNVMATLAILEAGSEEQKKGYLPRIATGELVLAMAVEEPAVNYDASMISTRAARRDSQYIIDGIKRFVPYATVADFLVVAARTSGDPGDAGGITLFLVDRQSRGLRFSPMKTIGGDRQFDVHFDGVSVPAANALGKSGGGLPVLGKIQKAAAALQCAEMVGGAQKELEMTAEYAKVRHQFDRPIGSFQAVQHRAADMFIDINGARLATYKAIWCLSEGREADREVSVAKYFTSRTCQRVAFSAQHLHGGIGVTVDYDLHFYYKRAKTLELKLGTQALHLRKLGAML